MNLRDYQLEAIQKMKNGCILCGGVGSGKSRTALAYYYLQNGGKIVPDYYIPMNDPPKDLYIITTARKRDTCEWEEELSPFLLSTNPDISKYSNKVVVDSWNNIGKYVGVEGAFFIFDEQRVVGSGAWVKAFLKITKVNDWILLSATPGDTWSDYIPVFVANGFYKNRTEFIRRHVVYSRFSKYPKVDRYLETGRLLRLRREILVNMNYRKPTELHSIDIFCEYNKDKYKDVWKNRWDPYKNEPIMNAGGLCYILRKIVNSDYSRIEEVERLVHERGRAIIFYNFDYELEMLRAACYGPDVSVAEWNGHKHEKIPRTEKWVYLVQYAAGAEGWNCTETDTIIFYSQNYSYKVLVQSRGRIDRMNTPFKDLYFYNLKSHSGIDLAIARALASKKKFNENTYAKGVFTK